MTGTIIKENRPASVFDVFPRDQSFFGYKQDSDKHKLSTLLEKNSFLKTINTRLIAIKTLKDDPEYKLVKK